jgi:predicted transcriptional regulator
MASDAILVVGQAHTLAHGYRREVIMADRDEAPPHLGELEQAIMEVLWQRQQATVREVVSELPRTPPLAYTTVATVMNRLVEKGLLLRKRSGKVDLYRATYDSAEFGQRAARAAVQRLIQDFGDVALAQFAAALESADPERIVRLRARYQSQQPPGQPQEPQATLQPEHKEHKGEEDHDADA